MSLLQLEKNEINYAAVQWAYQLKKIKESSYKKKKERILNFIKKDEWEMLCLSDECATTNRYGYSAIACVNRRTKKVHIASAGTVPSDYRDFLDNCRLMCGWAPAKVQPMKSFVDRIIQALGGQDAAADYEFNTSGHSLGAVVADLTGLDITSRGLRLGESVTFENPGSQKAINHALKSNLLSGTIDDQQLSELKNRCSVYNSKPNLINSAKPQFGKCNILIPDTSKNLPSRGLKEKQSTTGSKHYFKYLRSAVGSMASTCCDYLGISQLTQLNKNHSLKNFENFWRKTIVPVESWQKKKDKDKPMFVGKEIPALSQVLNDSSLPNYDTTSQSTDHKLVYRETVKSEQDNSSFINLHATSVEHLQSIKAMEKFRDLDWTFSVSSDYSEPVDSDWSDYSEPVDVDSDWSDYNEAVDIELPLKTQFHSDRSCRFGVFSEQVNAYHHYDLLNGPGTRLVGERYESFPTWAGWSERYELSS